MIMIGKQSHESTHWRAERLRLFLNSRLPSSFSRYCSRWDLTLIQQSFGWGDEPRQSDGDFEKHHFLVIMKSVHGLLDASLHRQNRMQDVFSVRSHVIFNHCIKGFPVFMKKIEKLVFT